INGTFASPVSGWRQDAGWGFQILPYIDDDTVWRGESNNAVPQANADKMTAALAYVDKIFYCPSRRSLAKRDYKNANFPSQALYSTTTPTSKGILYHLGMSDYAGCNGSLTPPGSIPTVNNGMIVSQGYETTANNGNGGPYQKNIVRIQDVTDNITRTLM